MADSTISAPDFDNLKKLAKELFQSYREGDPTSIRRVKTTHPAYGRIAARVSPPPFTLHDAQLVVAREAGFESWRAIKQEIDNRQRGEELQLASFYESAFLGQKTTALELLKKSPTLAKASFHTACLAGEYDHVAAMIKEEKDLAKNPGGPKNCPPLIYVAGSALLRHDPGRAKKLVKLAKLLLDNGAEVNVSYPHKEGARLCHLTPLYGAAGSANHAEMTELLLKAGANPNDGEALYHASEFKDHTCLLLLLKHGAKPEGTNALHRKLDFDDLEGARILLDHGADPNALNDGETALHWAIMRDRSAAIIKLLLERGASVTIKNGEGLTPFQMASRLGHKDAVKLLAKTAAKQPKLTAKEEFLAACAAGDLKAVKAAQTGKSKVLKSLTPADYVAFAEVAGVGRTAAVKAMIAAGFPLTAHGKLGETPLHAACWNGHIETVKALVKAGAPLDNKDESYEATPLGWAFHGSVNARAQEGDYLNPNADYAGIVKLLLQSGAALENPDCECPAEILSVLKPFQAAAAAAALAPKPPPQPPAPPPPPAS